MPVVPTTSIASYVRANIKRPTAALLEGEGGGDIELGFGGRFFSHPNLVIPYILLAGLAPGSTFHTQHTPAMHSTPSGPLCRFSRDGFADKKHTKRVV